MHILEQRIRNAHAEGRTALIPFITAGFPSSEGSAQLLRIWTATGRISLK